MIDNLGMLTDERAADGQPLLVMDGAAAQPLGPNDTIEVKGVSQPAWQAIEEWMNWTKPEGHDRELAARFVQLGKAAADE